MMSVGDLVTRNDLRFGRYRSPRPRKFWDQMLQVSGLGDPEWFGPDVSDAPDPVVPLIDEIELGMDPTLPDPPSVLPDPPSVGVFPVEDPRPMLRTESADAPLLVAGDAHGLVSAAGANLVDPDRPVFYSATFADDPDALRALAAEPGAELVVTDSNRKQGLRWGSVRENRGYTERADRKPIIPDVTDNRLDVFPDAGTDTQSVVETRGGATVDATTYGNGVSYTPGDKPAFAVDGSLRTAWRTGAFGKLTEDALQLTWDSPVTTDTATLVQSQRKVNRYMTEVELSFDDGSGVFTDPIHVDLGEESLSPEGQVIDFPKRTFKRLRLEILDTNVGELADYGKVSEVGIAELKVADTTLEDVVRPPTDLLDTLGVAGTNRPLAIVLKRAAANPEEVVLDDEEPSMVRTLSVPATRTFGVEGLARVPLEQPDESIDAILGIPDASNGGVTASSKARLPNLRARSASANDGDTSTAWQGPVNQGAGLWLNFEYPKAITVNDLQFTYLNDGRHSTPSVIHLEGADGAGAPIDIPAAEPGDQRGDTTTVRLALPKSVSGTSLRLVIDQVRPRSTREWFSHSTVNLPIGIAEVGWGGPTVPPAPPRLAPTCRKDLLSLDGTPVGVVLDATTDDLLDRIPVPIRSCDTGGSKAAAPTIELGPKPSLLRTTPGLKTGVDIDELWLRSAAGGSAVTPTSPDRPTQAGVQPQGPTAAPPATTTKRTGIGLRCHRAVLVGHGPVVQSGVAPHHVRRHRPGALDPGQRLRQRVEDRSRQGRPGRHVRRRVDPATNRLDCLGALAVRSADHPGGCGVRPEPARRATQPGRSPGVAGTGASTHGPIRRAAPGPQGRCGGRDRRLGGHRGFWRSDRRARRRPHVCRVGPTCHVAGSSGGGRRRIRPRCVVRDRQAVAQRLRTGL